MNLRDDRMNTTHANETIDDGMGDFGVLFHDIPSVLSQYSIPVFVCSWQCNDSMMLFILFLSGGVLRPASRVSSVTHRDIP